MVQNNEPGRGGGRALKSAWWLAAAVASLSGMPAIATAEPYIAVNRGLHCSACHVSQGGAGMRNAYGNAYAQTEMPGTRVGDEGLWTGEISRWFAVGGDLRADYRYVDTPNQPEVSEFDVDRGTVYLEARLIPGRLSVYVDQQVAPGGSLNREAYVKLRDEAGKWFVAAGQFYLPYGFRLQDDTAFVRQVTGINLTNPDRGVEFGYESGPWSAIASLTNGSGGGSETDTGKQASFVASYVQPGWRAGVSLNVNDTDAGDRQMQGLFLGFRTGPVAWLAEADLVRNDTPGAPEQDSIAGLVEANWLFAKGHNLKFDYEYFDPDDDVDEDHQVRYSLVWEHTPIQFVQARLGIRVYDGIPQIDTQNRDEFFLELHGFF